MFSLNVVIPTFCPGDYFYECLRCVKKQTLSDFSCSIILNGPKENYFDKIQKWIVDLEMTDTQVLYSPEAGVSAARNFALDCNEAEYLVFLDDDDLINETYLENLLANARHDVVVAAAVYNFHDGHPQQLSPDYMGREFRQQNVNEIVPVKCPSVFSSCCCKLIPTEIIGKTRFNKFLQIGEDSFFMYQLLAAPIDKVIYAPNALYLRRIRLNSSSKRRYSLTYILKNRLRLAYLFSTVYFANVAKMDVMFYFRRIVAIFTKGFWSLIRAGRC